MKRKIFTIAFFVLLCTISTLGQKSAISLSFTGIVNGQYAQLSRVDIRNLYKDCDTTLYWPDTVLSLNPLAINDWLSYNGSFHVFQNTPNPVTERTSVKIYVPETGMVQIQICDFSGNLVTTLNKELKKGFHTFLFTPDNLQTYLFTAIYKSEKSNIKIVVNTKSVSAKCSLSYLGPDDSDDMNKSVNALGKFLFSLGDSLEMTGYYTSLTAILKDNPTTSKTYTFTFSNPTPPTVTTSPVTNIYEYSATGGGNVTLEGTSPVTARGVCWSTSMDPTISDNHTSDGSGTGTFTSNINGLSATTPYYVRAFATNTAGTAYGNQVSFTTLGILVPTVTTDSVTNVTDTSATVFSKVTSEGSFPVTARGVCWSISPAPTTSDSHTTDGGGPGSFTSNIIGLTANTQYYVRAYATNALGTAYANLISFTTITGSGGPPCPGTPTVLYEGKTYNTVKIGTQCWLKENLNVGTRINGSQNQNPTNGIKEKYCYDDLDSLCNIYGGLYQWDELMQGATTPGVQGICPPGWHIPADTEWTVLTDFLGGDSIAGGKMKSISGWYNNGNGTNTSGFTALPGGFRDVVGNFSSLTSYAYFWSSSQFDATFALYRYLNFNNENMFMDYYYKTLGYSVRCVKD